MLRHPSSGRDRAALTGRDGFTLMETLVALAVLAVVMVPIERGIVGARSALLRAESRMTAGAVARTLLNQPIAADALKGSILRGISDDHAWTLTVEPLTLPFETETKAKTDAETNPTDPPAWKAIRLTIRVDAAPGRPVEVETVRLVAADKEKQ
jgi:prepilin-type N-terminal cleavage/methylation domain-containing protein